LCRQGVGNLKTLNPKEECAETKTKTFKDYEPGYVHMDINYLPLMKDESSRRSLFVAFDRAIRWVYLEILPTKSASNAAGSLRRLQQTISFRIKTILTDNSKKFTDRFTPGGERQPTGNHLFDKACHAGEI